ncbi:MAG: sulfite exporter TauE/SafE family protein [Bernardetiaceae bacterium]|nr:sulfite exporter TauE/SafE family protein [Bernardetiaceae bacterium]
MLTLVETYEWYQYVLIITASLIAGMINTVAGSGSLITLTVLSFIGLSTGMANGSNRIGVIIQSVVGLHAMRRGLDIKWKEVRVSLLTAILFGMIGAYTAVYVGRLNEIWLDRSIGIIMLLMLVLILNNPKKWAAKQDSVKSKKRPLWLDVLLFALIGFYAGFVQAGVGVLILVLLVAIAGYLLTNANGIKLVMVFCINLPAFAIFVYEGEVEWVSGILMGVGQAFGARLGGLFAVRNPKANIWIRWLMIVIVIIAIIRFLKLYAYFL